MGVDDDGPGAAIMAREHTDSALRHVHDVLAAHDRERLSDRELLRRFSRQRDEAAFTALVRRHGPMVLGVCRRTLGDEQDAEDAFQAAFLVLARKAGRLTWHESVGTWLYLVARRAALRARGGRARRRDRERRADEGTPPVDPLEAVSGRELCAALDDELSHLPERCRAPVVLCCLEGSTRDEAARRLGWSLATLKRRLERGRTLLRQRLTRRGFALPAALSAALWAEGAAPAAVPAGLLRPTVQAVTHAAAVPGRILALSEGVLRTMFLNQLRVAAAVFLIVCAAGAGAGLVARPGPSAEPAGEARPAAQEKAPGPPRAGLDRHGDPLPPGAVARLGTVRFRPGRAISALAFAPDGKVLATGNWGPGIHLYETATGKELRRLAGERKADSLAFSADGKNLASAGRGDKAVRLWDVDTGKEVGQFLGHQKEVGAVAFSPDGTVLASAGWDKTVRLWDATTGRELHRLEGHEREADCLSWSSDGKALASGGADKTVLLWETGTGQLLRRLAGHEGRVSRVAWSPDDKSLASGSDDGTLRLWEAATGKPLRVYGTGNVAQEKGRPLEKAAPKGAGVLGSCHGLAFSADGKALLSASQFYQTVRVWDVGTGKELRRMEGPQRVFCTALSADGKVLAVGGAAGQVDLWDVAKGEFLHRFAGHQGRAFCVAYSPDGKLLASGGDDHVCLWETGTWREVGQIKGHESHVLRLAFAPDGKALVSCGWDGAYLWDVAARKEIRSDKDNRLVPVRSVTFSPDGRLLAETGAGGLVVRDRADGKELFRFDGRDGRPGGATALAFSPDGRALALADERGIRLHEPATGKFLRRFEVPAQTLSSVAFSPDSRSLLSGGDDRVLRLWEVSTGKERCRFEGHRMPVHSVAVSPDGKVLASAGGDYRASRDHSDDSVRLWDAAKGKELRRLAGHRNVVVTVAFAPDGKQVASASEDNTILIWDATGLVPDNPPPKGGLTAKELVARWEDLAGEDAPRAYQAIWALAAAPEQTGPFLGQHMRPVSPVDAKQVARWVLDLDSPRFEARQQATTALEKMGELAEPALRKALAGESALDLRRRLEQLLEKLDGPITSPEALRGLRAVEVLERCGTPEARALLESLAEGAPASRLTRDAKASLERLGRR